MVTHVADRAAVTVDQIELNYTFALSSCSNINMASEKCIRCRQWDCQGGWVWGLRKTRALCAPDTQTKAGGGLVEGEGLGSP